MSRSRVIGATLVGVVTAGAIGVTSLGTAPAANADCASFFGIGNSASCTSSLTSIAIAIGNGATASATGLFGTAFAIGTGASAKTFAGAFTGALAVGDQAYAASDYYLAFAGALGGSKTSATAGGPGGLADFAVNIGGNTNGADADGLGNLAVNFFGSATGVALARGVGNVAVNAGGYYAGAQGYFNNATNLGSKGTAVEAFVAPSKPATLSWAFSILSSGGKVIAGYGPLAVAGSILQTTPDVEKDGPGININGIVVGGAAATHGAGKPAAARHPTAATTARTHTAARATAAEAGHPTAKR